MFLQKLDAFEESVGMKNNYLISNMDVEALYDSIKREHVNLAIRHAIEQCRKSGGVATGGKTLCIYCQYCCIFGLLMMLFIVEKTSI